jgi:hypothetical protein
VAIALFADDFSKRVRVDDTFRRYVEGLRGKRLGCHCKPLDCHLDVVVAYLEGEPK